MNDQSVICGTGPTISRKKIMNKPLRFPFPVEKYVDFSGFAR